MNIDSAGVGAFATESLHEPTRNPNVSGGVVSDRLSGRHDGNARQGPRAKPLTELKNRGVKDIFIVCVVGLKGFPETIEAIYPHTDAALHRASGAGFAELCALEALQVGGVRSAVDRHDGGS
jgi:Transposase, Mutator family